VGKGCKHFTGVTYSRNTTSYSGNIHTVNSEHSYITATAANGPKLLAKSNI